MNIPIDAFQMKAENFILSGWRFLVKNIDESIASLEMGIEEAEKMRSVSTPEWCLVNERIMDELNNRIFSISKPSWATDEDSVKFKSLKRRLHDLYRRYRMASER